MVATLIDGKASAARLREQIAAEASRLKDTHGLVPGLATVLVGSDPASEVYVRNKGKTAEALGFKSVHIALPADTSQDTLLAKVRELNQDTSVHGILVQLPLPKHINEKLVIGTIQPDKDVDGFHPVNAGRLATGLNSFVPCTPLGCLMLLKNQLGSLEGKEAVVIGRSNIVGKPMAQLLLGESCTVTIAHSKTKDLPGVVRRADIVVAAVGRPQMVKGNWIKAGATVIDVGINRIDAGEGKTRLVGDVAFDDVKEIAGAITPVPGGVGPMTIVCLMHNTLIAACLQNGLPIPRF
jgi:methylenetetrahydrofolate dehydrogenase (NADP+)/methenyltetrahydrofolate cyclohydrolase